MKTLISPIIITMFLVAFVYICPNFLAGALMLGLVMWWMKAIDMSESK